MGMVMGVVMGMVMGVVMGMGEETTERRLWGRCARR